MELATVSHLRSSRLLLGQARCWPGGFWVLCRQASMAELGACGAAHSAAGSRISKAVEGPQVSAATTLRSPGRSHAEVAELPEEAPLGD